MKKKLVTQLLFFVSLTTILTGCLTKGEPSALGELVTIEQIAEIEDDSWNGRVVAVKGYPAFHKKVVKLSEKNEIRVISSPEDKTFVVCLVGISNADSKQTVIIGEKSRNRIAVSPNELDISKATFITDDYQEVPYQELIFSGEMVFDTGSYYLTNVTIHLPE